MYKESEVREMFKKEAMQMLIEELEVYEWTVDVREEVCLRWFLPYLQEKYNA